MNSVLNIGVSRAGGFGDNLNTTAYIAAIKRVFPNSSITVYVSRYPEVFDGNPCIDKVVKLDGLTFDYNVASLKKIFDVFFEIKYACFVSFNPKVVDYPGVRKFKEVFTNNWPKYEKVFNRFLYDIPLMEKMGRSHYQITADSSNLPVSMDEMFINITEDHYKASSKYKGLRYVTINNSAYGGTQTKCWKQSGWEPVIQYLRSIGYYTVQVGESSEQSLDADDRFTGSLFETAALMKGARFHIGPEGGLIHLAKTVGINSVVLFGPTSIKTFGYDNNENLKSKACSLAPCWWRSVDWMERCKKTGKLAKDECPPCMQELTHEDVIQAVNKLLKKKGIKVSVPPSLDMSDAQLEAAVKAEEQEILKRVKGKPQEFFEQEAMVLPLDASVGYSNPLQMKRVHAILDMVGSGKKVLDVAGGDGFISSLIRAQGNEVTLTDISEIRVMRARYLNKLDAVLCRAEKLPFKDESFDVVVAAEVLEHCERMSVPLAEAERVCKKDGKVIVTLPVHPMHDEYEQHLKSIRMTNIDDNMLVLSIENIGPHVKKFQEFNKQAK